MNCLKCGASIAEDSWFCYKCGAEVTQSVVESSFGDTEAEKLDGRRKLIKTFKEHWVPLLIVGCAILGFVVMLAVFTVESSSSGSNSSYDSGYSYNSVFSDSYLKTVATNALYRELKSHFNYTELYDIGATRYSIGSIVEDGSGWIVRGQFSMCDYYGKISSTYYGETFTVKIDSSGRCTSCTTSL